MIWTSKTPDSPGHYWWCNFWNGGEPTEILEVTNDGKKFHANGGEYCFEITKKPAKFKKLSDAELWNKGLNDDGSEESIEFWCKIPEPEIPQIPCAHPIDKLTRRHTSNTGNYDPTAEDYSKL